MRLRAKVDANQPEIVDALRKIGASVQHLHTVGRGCPDLLVGYFGDNFLMEIKDGKNKLNTEELIWHVDWKGSVYVVRSAEEAIRIVRGG